MRLIAFAPLLFCAGFTGLFGVSSSAAEQPMGSVTVVAGKDVTLTFDPSAHLSLGAVVAIFGAGQVERHPLTNEAIIERRALVAKVQILALDSPQAGQPAQVKTRVVWTGPGAIEIGCDAVPLPGEAAPNSPPALTAGLGKTSASAGSTVTVTLPITDPDGDAVTYQWLLEGTLGSSGRLDARSTRQPSVNWTAPASLGTATLHVIATDAWGNRTEASSALEAVAIPDARKRELTVFARYGMDAEPAVTRLVRASDGAWLGLTDSGAIRSAPGWATSAALSLGEIRRPLAIAEHGGNRYVLDGGKNEVAVLNADGAVQMTLGGLDRPTDVVVGADGLAFVADQAAGGVLVYEADGRFRCRLGRAGNGADEFKGLTRLALSPAGELYALDPATRRVHRFDRALKRLSTWELAGDANQPATAIAMHPRGLLVLQASGVVTIYDAKGIGGEGVKPLEGSPLVDKPGKADALAVDLTGEWFVTYPDQGLIARYTAAGTCSGIRGGHLRTASHWAADGQGRLFAGDDDGAVWAYDLEGWRVAKLPQGLPTHGKPTLAASPDGQGLTIVDSRACTVTRVKPDEPAAPAVVFGQPGKNNGQFGEPVAAALDAAGRSYVLDADLHRVAVFDGSGAYLTSFSGSGKNPQDLREPKFIAVSSAGDAIFVYDAYRYEVKKYAVDQQAKTITHVGNTGGKGSGPGQFREPLALGCDRQGFLYVVDSSRGDVQVIDFHGSSAVPLYAKKLDDLGIRKPLTATTAPDGQVFIAGDGTLTGLRW